MREYVRSGGNLIVSGRASLQDDNFLLKDILNVSFQKQNRSKLKLQQFWDGIWDVYLKLKKSRRLLPVKEFTFIKTGQNTQCLGKIVLGMGSACLTPAIVKNNFANGICCYINFPPERIYDEFEEPEFVEIINSVIEAILPDKSPCKISCRQRLYFSLKEKDNLKILYLCNPIAETRTFIVNVLLKTNVVPDKVYSWLSGENIKYEIKNEQIIIRKHSFEDFECIAVKF